MTDSPVPLALSLIETQRTLVLATAAPDAWAAPVYYFYRNRRFYFFSSPNSRHVAEALQSGRCAGSVFRDSEDWRKIEGLQMEGTVHAVKTDGESRDAFAGYVHKFPTVRDFFAGSPFDFQQFLDRFRTRLYAFAPARVFYLNNQAGLGKRREIELPA